MLRIPHGLDIGSQVMVRLSALRAGGALSPEVFPDAHFFKYLGTTVTNQNLIQEDIKRRLNSGNACYHSVQNLLSSRLLSKKCEGSVWV
jgi:hypothetical protein